MEEANIKISTFLIKSGLSSTAELPSISLLLYNIKMRCFIDEITDDSDSRMSAYCQCLWKNRLVIPECKQNMTSLRGQASWAKMTLLRGKLTLPAYHPTKSVNKVW
jgi:hypothetical protein